ncbi:MAG: response regulator transcription factor [Elusimicrobiota bacterium]
MNILVIDDSEAAQIAFEQVLSNEGYDVTAAGTAEEGLQSIRKKAPDLIVLDVQLPDILGTHLCEMLKNDPATRYIPILMCTGHKDVAHGLNQGADDYLVKPCGKDEMVARVNALLRRVELAEERAREKVNLKQRQEQAQKPPAAAAPRPEHAHAASSSGKTRRSLKFAWASLAYPLDSLAKLDEVPAASALTPVLILCLFLTAVRLVGSHPEPWPHAALSGFAEAAFLWTATALLSVLLLSGLHWKDTWPKMTRVCAAAAAPLALRAVLTLLYALICDGAPGEFSAGPLLLPPLLHAGPSAAAWLARVDFFALWWAAVVAIGAQRFAKTSKARTAIVGIGAYALWILAQAVGRLAAGGS